MQRATFKRSQYEKALKNLSKTLCGQPHWRPGLYMNILFLSVGAHILLSNAILINSLGDANSIAFSNALLSSFVGEIEGKHFPCS